MNTIEITWGTSRARDTYGYTVCTLRQDGQKIARCNGGGYDMRGTVVGHWLAVRYADRLRALKPEDMPEQSHWESDDRAFVCRKCVYERVTKGLEPVTARVPEGWSNLTFEQKNETWPVCPECGQDMERDNRAGQRVSDGRRLYGLTFHDPNYDPGKAVIGEDTQDRTLGGATSKTVEEAERAGKSVGLERYQAIYRASSPVPTERHTIPSIDGACGMSSVERIAKAIGISLRQVVNRSKHDVYVVVDERRA